MIYKNENGSVREITGISVLGKQIEAVYHGARLVWRRISSCFGRGYWIQNYPWLGEDAWKNTD